jgi:hypothetical protein
MKIMTLHSSATALDETPHVTETTQITISDALRRRAQAVINDSAIDPQWRAIVRYALEINDPLLADLVRRADAGETIIDTADFSQTPETNEDDSSEEKIEALAEIICRTVINQRLRCSCSWERWRIPRIPNYSQTRRSTLLLLAVVS